LGQKGSLGGQLPRAPSWLRACRYAHLILCVELTVVLKQSAYDAGVIVSDRSM